MNLSSRDKKLLVYLIAIGLIAGTYFFIARPKLDQQQKFTDEINAIKPQVNHYNEIRNNQENYERQIADAQTQYNETLDKFFGGLNQENTIINIKEIEDSTNVWISRVSFQDSQIMVGGNGFEDIQTEEGAVEGVETEVSSSGELSCMKQDLYLEFSCSYPNYKRFIEYIQNYDQRLFISSMDSKYSIDSNQVMGSLILSQYALLGTDKEYEAPDLSNIGTGVDNIFTTLRNTPSQSEEGSEGVQTLEDTDEESGESEGDENTDDEDTSDDDSQSDDE